MSALIVPAAAASGHDDCGAADVTFGNPFPGPHGGVWTSPECVGAGVVPTYLAYCHVGGSVSTAVATVSVLDGSGCPTGAWVHPPQVATSSECGEPDFTARHPIHDVHIHAWTGSDCIGAGVLILPTIAHCFPHVGVPTPLASVHVFPGGGCAAGAWLHP